MKPKEANAVLADRIAGALHDYGFSAVHAWQSSATSDTEVRFTGAKIDGRVYRCTLTVLCEPEEQ